MVSTFVVLAIVLLALPVAAGIFVCIANTNKKKRAKVMANAATIKTTVTQGSNGRTVFEATATRATSTRPQRLRHSTILPYNIQQAYKAPSPRKPSLKNTWQRLSRPFSVGLQQYDDHHIELTQKQPPLPYKSMSQQHIKRSYEEPISPIITPNTLRNNSRSSWNTVDHLDHNSDPISPLSVTNVNATSSITGAVLHCYQSRHQPPAPISHMANPQTTFDTIPLTPPSRKQSQPADISAARGLVPLHMDIANKKVMKDLVKQKGKEIGTKAGAAGAGYTADKIKTYVVDANKTKFNTVLLAKPPKVKAKNQKPYDGFI